MYTSYIGKKFLKYYNEQENKNYTAREFFDEVMFPLFFDHPTFLMWVHNSPFDQLYKEASKKRNEHKKKKLETEFISPLEIKEERLKKKNELIAKIEAKEISGSTAVGYYVADVKGVSSGQITDIKFQINDDELFCSWLGQALAIGFSGGYLLVENEDILYQMFKGWQIYRQTILSTPNLKGNQIETWNGQIIVYLANHNDATFEDFNPETELKNDKLVLHSTQWTNVILSLSKIIKANEINCYGYVLGKNNKTYGFIKIFLNGIKYMYELRDSVFIDESKSALTEIEIKKLIPHYKFNEACKSGAIGLSSLEPDKLRDFLPIGSYYGAKGNEIKDIKKNYQTFLIYKLWVIAMIKKMELRELAAEFISAIIEQNQNLSNKRGKQETKQELKDIFNSRNIKVFIEHLTTLLEKQNQNANLFDKIVDEVLKMPVDNFPLFLVLLKFEYSYQINLGVEK